MAGSGVLGPEVVMLMGSRYIDTRSSSLARISKLPQRVVGQLERFETNGSDSAALVCRCNGVMVGSGWKDLKSDDFSCAETKLEGAER